MELNIPPTTIGLLCIANLCSLALNVALLVDWIRNWRHVKVHWAYGVGAGLGAVAIGVLQVGAVALSILPASGELAPPVPPGWEGRTMPPIGEGDVAALAPVLLLALLLIIAVGLLAILASLTQVAGVTMLGIHYADSLGHPSVPLLRRLFRREHPVAADKALPAPAGDGPGEGEALPLAAGQSPATARRRRGDYALSTLGVAAAGVAYSVLLFRLTSPRMSDVLAGMPGYTPERVEALTLAVLVTVVGAAFSQEIIYRLGIQGFLARYLGGQGSRYWLPVVLTSLLWTLQHVGVMEPGWVKMAQIFPIGLLLGWLYRRHGVESCILAHAVFNVALAPLTPFLIGA